MKILLKIPMSSFRVLNSVEKNREPFRCWRRVNVKRNTARDPFENEERGTQEDYFLSLKNEISYVKFKRATKLV